MIKQLSISDFFEDFNNIVTKPHQLLQLLDQYISIGNLIPSSWSFHYYKHTGRPHDNSLFSIVACLLMQKLLSIPTHAKYLVSVLFFMISCIFLFNCR